MQAHCDDHTRNTRGCAGCRKRNADYNRARKAGLRDGSWERLVRGPDLVPVRQHLRVLLQTPGVTTSLIADAAGTSVHTVLRVLKDENAGLGPRIAEALLLTTPRACLSRADDRRGWVPSVGVARRLQALTADGWDTASLSALCGISIPYLSNLRRG